MDRKIAKEFMITKLNKRGLKFSEKSIELFDKAIDIYIEQQMDLDKTIEELSKVTVIGETSEKIIRDGLNFFKEEYSE